MEIDNVAVNAADWELARKGDKAAQQRIAGSIDGLTLYLHILTTEPDEILVTLRELQELHIINSVTISRRH